MDMLLSEFAGFVVLWLAGLCFVVGSQGGVGGGVLCLILSRLIRIV